MKLKEISLPRLGSAEYENRLSVMLYEYLRDIRTQGNGLTTAQEMQEQALFRGINLNMQSTADQALTALTGNARYVVTRVVAVNRSGGASVACAGGIYSAAAKGGVAIVAAAQSWVTLTAANKIVLAALAAICGTDAQTSQLQYLSLTTGSTAACTADVYVYGIPV